MKYADIYISIILCSILTYLWIKPELAYKYSRFYSEEDKPGVFDKKNSTRAIRFVLGALNVVVFIYFIISITMTIMGR